MADAIVTSGLRKAFGKTQALDGVDLRIRRGAVYGLLGPNGAGKTTAIRVLATLLRPDEGQAYVLGHDVVREAKAVRERIGLTGQYASVDDDLTGHENLVLVGRLLGLPWRDARERATQLLEAFALDDAAKRLVRTYSGGMRRRIDIAASLVATPEVLFLDEPTTGLDPRSRNQVWDLVRHIAAQGTTVLLTTQHLEEADRLAERLAVVDQGRVIAEGTSRELKAMVGQSALHIRFAARDDRAVAEGIVHKATGNGFLHSADGEALAVKVGSPAEANKVLAALSARGVRVSEFSLGNPSLDDVFFALTGHAAEPAAKGNGEASAPIKGSPATPAAKVQAPRKAPAKGTTPAKPDSPARRPRP
jgi:ABC-2 type transport system ATP-binding protein